VAKSSEYELAIKIAGKVDKSLKAATKSAGSEMKSLQDTAKNAMKGIAVAAAAVTTAAVAAGKALYDLGSEFDGAYDAIRIGTGATGEALEDLKQSMKNVYASVPTDMESAAAAISDYNTRLGLTGTGLETLSEQAIKVSGLLGDDLGGIIEASSQSFQIFGLNADQMSDSMDWLFKVSQSTGIGFTELTSLVQRNGAAFQQMGFSYNESAAMLGKLEKAGYETSTVMTAMTYAVKASAKMGLEGKDAYEQYYDSILSAKDETKAISLAMELFGSRSGTVMAQAIRDGTLAMEDFVGELEASGETINTAAADTYDLAEKWQMFKNRIDVALEPIANTVFDTVNETVEELMPTIEALIPSIVNGIQTIIPKIVETIKWLVENKDTILGIAGAVATLVASYKAAKVIMAAVNTVQAITKAITIASTAATVADTTAKGAATVATTGLAAATTALNLPLLAVAAAIAAVIAIGVLLYKNWDTIKAKAIEIGAKIGEIWTGIKDWVSGAVSSLLASFSETFPMLSAYISGWWESISAAWENVKAIFSNIIDFVKNVFAGDWSAAWENIVNIFGNLFGMLVNLAKAPINGVISAINWVLSKINSISITIPDWVPGVGGKTLGFNIPTIPALAQGGVATAATLAMVGEGSEPEAILPLSKLAAMLEGIGGGSVNNDDHSQSDSVVFSPVFNFYGGASKEQAEEAGRISFAEFKRLYRQMKSEERRKSFNMA
jgi:TP901 family phage tail tape measure protein